MGKTLISDIILLQCSLWNQEKTTLTWVPQNNDLNASCVHTRCTALHMLSRVTHSHASPPIRQLKTKERKGGFLSHLPFSPSVHQQYSSGLIFFVGKEGKREGMDERREERRLLHRLRPPPPSLLRLGTCATAAPQWRAWPMEIGRKNVRKFFGTAVGRQGG